MSQLVKQPQGQGGDGVIAQAVAGGSLTIEVGPNDAAIVVTNNTTGEQMRVKVSPGKDTTVPIPNVPAGTGLTIKVGTGLNARIIPVEVIAPGP